MSREACPIVSPGEYQRQLKLLREVKTIAVIGMSPNPDRPSHEVGLYLRDKGYVVIPVHPAAREIAGLKVYPSLTAAAAAHREIDLVDLFVAGDRTGPIVEEAHRLGLRRIWFQPGAENDAAEKLAVTLGLETVTRACTMAVLQRSKEKA